jgi:hypothetical protein
VTLVNDVTVEVIVTDRLGQISAERFWDNIPYTPPPNPEEITPPKFSEILRFREEFGLDLDIKGDENAIDERIFDLIAAWHNPNTPDGEVARASDERWGVPLRPKDVAEMEYRAAYIAADRQLLEEWVATSGHAGTYAGYYVDNRAGGILRIGFTSGQATAVAEFLSQAHPEAAERIAEYPSVPTTSIETLQKDDEAIAAAQLSTPGLASISNVGINPEADRLTIEASDTAAVESAVAGILGSGAPISVTYSAESGTLYSGRNRAEGRVASGDRILGLTGQCSAGFGAYEDRNKKSNGELVRARFLLTAAHCYNLGETVSRTAANAEEPPIGDWAPLGTVNRHGIEQGKLALVGTDGEGIRLEGSDLAPDEIDGNGRKLPVSAARPAEINEDVCASGERTNEPKCGPIVGTRYIYSKNGAELWWVLRVKLPENHGDSGAPVWDPVTHAAIGSVTGGPQANGPITWVTPLIHPDMNPPATVMPGILHAPGMYSNPLRLIVEE